MTENAPYIAPDAERSRIMAAVKNKHTAPERHVRRVLFGAGFRYRLHNKKLPGTPDIYLGGYSVAIFVHGCFWHNHRCPKGRKMPRRNANYWQTKIFGNAERDKRRRDELQMQGIRVLTIWECAIKGKHRLSDEALLSEIKEFLHDSAQHLAELPVKPVFKEE